MKAFRLHDASCSPSKKFAINSGASGIRKSKFLKIVITTSNFWIVQDIYSVGQDNSYEYTLLKML